MSRQPTPASRVELVEELTAFAFGGGLLTLILAPLAVPILALAAVPVIALALAALMITLVAAILSSPILLTLRFWRRHRTRAVRLMPGQIPVGQPEERTPK